MTHSSLASWVRAAAIATIVTSLLLAALIVFAEEFPALKDWLKATFYHHWLGKGALALSVFAVVSIPLSVERRTTRLSTIVFVEALAVITAVCVIAGFFLLHLLKLT